MILYHGTSRSGWEAIQRGGVISPRGRRAGNWSGDVRSHPRVIYLTDSYPLFFAASAAGEGEDLIVLELELGGLEDHLVPDEDVLAQVDQAEGRLDTGERLAQRTRRYRRELSNYQTAQNARASLELMGTCGLLCGKSPRPAGIRSDRVRRVATVTPDAYVKLVMWGHDPIITLANYRFMGERYRRFTGWLFDPPVTPPEDETASVPAGLSYLNQALPSARLRAGISVEAGPCTTAVTRDRVVSDPAVDTPPTTERGA